MKSWATFWFVAVPLAVAIGFVFWIDDRQRRRAFDQQTRKEA